MTTLNRRYATLELSDGSVHEVRIVLADNIAQASTARRNKWDLEGKDAFIGVVYLAFAAAKRAGLVTCAFSEFYEGDHPVCLDLNIDDDESRGNHEHREDGDISDF